ncbi:MAG: hypothetical protein ABFD54_12285 [Armatimonadota bacterium]|nr:hypothetical protein [bacterium]
MGTKKSKNPKLSIWLAGIAALTAVVVTGVASNWGWRKLEANQIRSPWDISAAPPQYAAKNMVRITDITKPNAGKKPWKTAKGPVTVANAAPQK